MNRIEDTPHEQPHDGPAPAAGPALAPREPYSPPVIEKHAPLGNVTFGTNVQPKLAMALAGA